MTSRELFQEGTLDRVIDFLQYMNRDGIMDKPALFK